MSLSPEEDRLRAQLLERVRERFAGEATGHGAAHLERVERLALAIQREEGGDPFVLSLAALVHDVHRLMQSEQGRWVAPVESLPEVATLLEPLSLPEDTLAHVLSCVEHHEEYAFSRGAEDRAELSRETRILQDADNLDALGAVGLARAFAFGGALGQPLWVEGRALPESFAEGDPAPSTVHHIQTKLLRLADAMNTETGRRLARERHAEIERFLERFFDEWRGA